VNITQAAEADGDIEEAQLQQEALEELEEKVVEVAAAEESEAAHAQVSPADRFSSPRFPDALIVSLHLLS
jgi:hypothetical protein